MAQDMEWKFILNDGSVHTEHHGEWTYSEEARPWVRFCSYIKENDLRPVRMELKIKDQTVIFPCGSSGFGLGALIPEHYSLAYRIEVDDLFGERRERNVADFMCNFENFTLHYMVDLTTLVVTLAVTPPETNNLPSDTTALEV